MVRSLVRQGAFLPAVEYVRAHRVRQKIIQDYQAVMRTIDVIAMPVVPFPAWPVGAAEVTIEGVTEELMGSLTRYCPPFNITGQPAISVPSGFDRDGLPLAFQIAGRWREDATVLRVAQACAGTADGIPATETAMTVAVNAGSPRRRPAGP